MYLVIYYSVRKSRYLACCKSCFVGDASLPGYVLEEPAGHPFPQAFTSFLLSSGKMKEKERDDDTVGSSRASIHITALGEQLAETLVTYAH